MIATDQGRLLQPGQRSAEVVLRLNDFGYDCGLPSSVLLEDDPGELIANLKRPALLPVEFDGLLPMSLACKSSAAPESSPLRTHKSAMA